MNGYGMTLEEIEQTVERHEREKLDLVVDPRSMAFRNGAIAVWDSGGDRFAEVDGVECVWPVRESAHRQIASAWDVPVKHYMRLMADHPALWAQELETLAADVKNRRMIRVLGGTVRAVVSDGYRILDNAQLLGRGVLPLLREREASGGDGRLRFESGYVSEARMFLKFTAPELRRNVRREGRETDDAICCGVRIRNDETGHGGLAVDFFTWRLVCANGMHGERVFDQRHLGERSSAGRLVHRDDTLKARDEVLWRELRDAVDTVTSAEFFDLHMDRLNAATVQDVTQPIKAMEVVTKRFKLREDEKDAIQMLWIKSDDLSRFGLIQAITGAAKVSASYERSDELEGMGGAVLALSGREWREIASASTMYVQMSSRQ